MPKNNNSSSNIKDDWPKITITNIIIDEYEILGELLKYDTDVKWANIVGEMVAIGLLLKAGLPFNLQEIMKHEKAKHNKTRYASILT